MEYNYSVYATFNVEIVLNNRKYIFAVPYGAPFQDAEVAAKACSERIVEMWKLQEEQEKALLAEKAEKEANENAEINPDMFEIDEGN